jgi:hypothetical protein
VAKDLRNYPFLASVNIVPRTECLPKPFGLPQNVARQAALAARKAADEAARLARRLGWPKLPSFPLDYSRR